MKNVFTLIFAIILLVIICSLFFASIFMLNASLSIKILIISGLAIFMALFDRLNNLEELMRKILYFQRVSYISLEKKRLEPDDLTPASDIIIDDIKYENDMSTFLKECEGATGVIIKIIIFILLIGAVCIVTFSMLNYWP